MHVDVSRGRPRVDAAGGRDRVRQRHRGAKRERTVRRHSHRGGNRQLCGFNAGRRSRTCARGAYRGGSGAVSRNPTRRRLRRQSRRPEFAHEPAGGLARIDEVSRRLRQVARTGSQLRGVAIPSSDADGDSARESIPGYDDHPQSLGGPLGIGPYEGRRAEIFGEWKKNITDLARCPNVVAKLGGINMPINGFGWHRRPAPPTSDELVSATRDYYLHTIDQFG